MAYDWFQPAPIRRSSQQQQVRRESQRTLAVAASRAAHQAAAALRDQQRPEGYWCGELLADTTLESDYVLLQLWLHPPVNGRWAPPSWNRVQKAANAILGRQMSDGGFWIYPGGPADINATVKAYTALKLAGVDPDSEPMTRARRRALALGGVQAANSYTKINLSLFGLFPREHVPSIPPELVLAPGGLLYEMSSWTRAILVPLSIVQAKGGVRPVPQDFNVDELSIAGKSFRLPRKDTVSLVFHQLDRAIKIWESRGSQNIRGSAIREAERWMLDRTRYSDGLGAIYPSMMYYIMALQALGYPDDHPDLIEAIHQFDALMLEGPDQLIFQPCVSPVWDTAIAAFALGELGENGNPEAEDSLRRAADWLIAREVRHRGDWSVKRPDLEPSGWAFEFNNEHYPDIDDTAQALLALEFATASDPLKQQRCERRAAHWLRNMQSKDGGWAAFDVDNDWAILNKVPFADHNAMLDPTCPDITGRVIEALCRRARAESANEIDQGVNYLLSCQEKNGSWYGRWGVNYVYGTFLALRGLRAAGDPKAQPAVKKAGEWIRTVQNPDGGWGESCASYLHHRFVAAPSTPSQTSWAILGLLAAGKIDSPALQRGISYLIENQREDGTWDEDHATGTGFPNIFYLRYTMYRNYFPILALEMAQRALRRSL